jgi:hypothetical protein
MESVCMYVHTRPHSYMQANRYRYESHKKIKQTPWPVVRKRTIPTERPPLDGEVSANSSGQRVAWTAQRIPTAVNLGFLDRSRYFLEITQLYSRSTTSQKKWQRRESNRNLWICSQELWPLDHGGGYDIGKKTGFKFSALLWKLKSARFEVFCSNLTQKWGWTRLLKVPQMV